MLYILTDGTIRLTRGDTAKLTVSISNSSSEDPYVIQPSDILRFTVRKTVKDPVICFQKEIIGSALFIINPSDTEDLSFGQYKYDVELTNAAEEVYTVIAPTTFEVMPEVTY